jgi:hypothetical protein
MRNMWIVIFGCFFSVLVDTIYSLWLFVFSDAHCHVNYISQGTFDALQFFDYLSMYFLWTYPLLYVFWPSVRVFKQQDKYRSAVEAVLAGMQEFDVSLSASDSFVSGA